MTARNATDWEKAPAMPAGHFVSGRVYTDDAVFADEKARIFGKIWHLACHESEVPNAYDFRAVDYAGIPLIVVRGRDGVVRSFINVCSHRGAKIVNEPSGNAKRVTCFYHLWSYDDRGACIDIPRAEGYARSGLRKEDAGLRAVRTEIHLGLVFITLDDAAAPLADFLDGALTAFDDVLGRGDLEVFHYHSAVLDANWKAWQETNLDIYHEFMHVLLRRTQLTAGSMDERAVTLYRNAHALSAGLKAKYESYAGMQARPQSLTLPGIAPDDFFYVNLFPNASLLARGTVIRVDTVTPIDARRCLVEWRGLAPKGEPDAARLLRMQHHNQYWGPFGRNVPEDAFAVEACEKGFAGGGAAFQIIAREENMSGQDDGMLRAWYAEWARRMERLPGDPVRGKGEGS